MKKLTFTLLTSLALSVGVNAQSLSCGSSGAAACSTGTTLAYNGFEFYDDIECFESGVQNEVVVRFKTFTNLTIPGTGAVTVYFLKIDSIKNLPCGLCWESNKQGDVFAGGEQGCIVIKGLTTDQVGQYKLELGARAQIQTSNPQNPQYNPQALISPPGKFTDYENDIENTRLYVRVKGNGSSTCTNVDTTAASKVAVSACTGVGINEATTAFSSISISPSPFNSSAVVNFTSEETGDALIAVTDIAGKTVAVNNVAVSTGNNTTSIERGNLSAGLYILSISKGKSVVTKRFSIID
jgi:hypothetical protein